MGLSVSEGEHRYMKSIFVLIIMALVSAGLSWYFYYYKKQHFLFNFWGAVVVGLIGAVLGNFLFNYVYLAFKSLDLNILAVFIGAYLCIKTLTKFSP